jgi:hypothetical protein
MPVDSTTSGRSSGSDANHGTGLGVLVGGRSSRMGGQPKGLLRVPGSDESLVVHALRVGTRAGCAPMLAGG